MRTTECLGVVCLALGLAGCGDVGTGEAPATTGTPVTAEPACELVMGWDPWEPYQYEIAAGQVFGLDVDLIRAVTGHSDCELALQKGSWRDLLLQLRDGDIDLLAGATRTPDREDFAYFTAPYREEEFLFYIAADRFDELAGMELEELMDAGLRIGVVEDYLYPEPVSGLQDDPEHAAQFEYASMAETSFSRLFNGEIDGLVEDRYVGAAIIRHKDLGFAITAHPLRFRPSPVRIMISRASVDEPLFERLDQSVKTLRANGAFDRILAQYRNP